MAQLHSIIIICLFVNHHQSIMATATTTSSINSKGLIIGGYSEGYLLKRAEEIVADKEKGSRVFNTEMEARYPRFHSSGTLLFIFARAKEKIALSCNSHINDIFILL